MKKIIRLTESDLSEIVKKVIERENINEINLFKKWKVVDEIVYKGYIIPVYQKGDETLLGHPREENDNYPNFNSESIGYDMKDLNRLKRSIDVMVENPGKTDFDFKHIQSALTGMNMSGTPVPSIFPKEKKIIKNPYRN
jgi:hypothetical protein